jgi:AGZA family xanthine/uracil permease-like MFS transporter
MRRFFAFQERNTSYKQETIAGITTFLSMAYILIVNPAILSQAGMDKGAVFTATALTAIIGTLIIGLFANYPVVIAPSMGLNSFFTFTVCQAMGIPWEIALTGVFVSGVLFLLLSLLKIREMIINMIPQDLKHAIAAGIGFFIAFIGLKNAGIITASGGTIIGLGDLATPEALLALFGFGVTYLLFVRGVNGGIFLGMGIATIAGIATGVIEKPASFIGSIPSLKPTFGVVFSHLHELWTPEIFAVIFTFLFVAFFDTAGALIAVASQAGLVKDNKIPNAGRALVSDSAATIIGSILGTSTTATMIESNAGIAAGGRTGFTSLITAALIFLSMFFSPVLSAITGEITAAALMIVGALMATEVKKINWKNPEIVIPCFMTILMMPLSSSVATGIAAGFILYPIGMIVAGKGRDVHPVMYILFLAFLAYFLYM